MGLDHQARGEMATKIAHFPTLRDRRSGLIKAAPLDQARCHDRTNRRPAF